MFHGARRDSEFQARGNGVGLLLPRHWPSVEGARADHPEVYVYSALRYLNGYRCAQGTSPYHTDHAEKLHELPDEYFADVLPAAKKIALALNAEHYNLLQVSILDTLGVHCVLILCASRTMDVSLIRRSITSTSTSSPSLRPATPRVLSLAGPRRSPPLTILRHCTRNL